ncbi:MAG: PIN domain-containing protein [Devosia sp.]|uniref:PIN domain-containing protein n=1 Tax=Devosia sp. TaxID=1871048 RepID=UPI001A41CB46|nr:PIN domain-containing protein [Devosia sp.]MBL8597116.1 PIN domain-containing protein [Devosia sp.]
MGAEFADSNVMLCLAGPEDRRALRAHRLVDDGLTISAQVLNEIANVMVRKWKHPWPRVTDFLATLRSQTLVVPVDEDVHEKGLYIALRYKLTIYDSMIVAAALLAGCDTLYTEDMHPGLVIENRLRIVNPFAGT